MLLSSCQWPMLLQVRKAPESTCCSRKLLGFAPVAGSKQSKIPASTWKTFCFRLLFERSRVSQPLSAQSSGKSSEDGATEAGPACGRWCGLMLRRRLRCTGRVISLQLRVLNFWADGERIERFFSAWKLVLQEFYFWCMEARLDKERRAHYMFVRKF